MKKSYTRLFFLILFFPSLHAMHPDEETPKEMNKDAIMPISLDLDSINKILKVNDPAKFTILARKFVMQNHPDAKREGFQTAMSKEEKIKSLQDSMSKIIGLNTGLLEELDELGNQSVQQCNRARQRGGLYAFAWFTFTGIFLGIEGYLLFQELSTETKVASGVPLFAAAYGSVTKFLDNANKIINNTHINEKIEKQAAKIEALSKIKYDIAQDIKSLTKEISSEHKNKSLLDTTKQHYIESSDSSV